MRIDAFRDALAEASIPISGVSDLRRYDIDEITPTITVAPSDEEQVAQTLALVHGLAVIAFGSGGLRHIGNVPRAFDVALETTGLDKTIEHEPDDMTVTVDAGVTLSTLQTVLAGHGQRLPIDPPCEDDPTIGGLLAVNAYGPMRHAYGTLRDWVIGMRVAHPDGTVTKSGGRVVKNVSGYDMHKLHIGALGTLGVITQATFKLAPLPYVTRTVAFATASPAAACDLILGARDAGLAVEAAEVLSPGGARRITERDGWCALMRVAASSAAVDRSLRDLPKLAAGSSSEEAGYEAWARWSGAAATPTSLSLRLSVLPSRVTEVLRNLDDASQAPGAFITSTVSAGVIRVKVDATRNELDVINDARRAAELAGGFLIVDAASPEVKASIDVFGSPGSDFEVMRRLKQQFDPHGTLAPGRFLGRL